MNLDADRITKSVGAVTAVFAMVGGGYTVTDKLGVFNKPILEWSAENFSISDGPANEEFYVVVARRKIRDDCSVEQFNLEVRDSRHIVHTASPSIARFSGPTANKVEKFGYAITIDNPGRVAAGKATLLARIKYKCPEGEVLISYPDHANLTFNITK